jgi:hypothetical protein
MTDHPVDLLTLGRCAICEGREQRFESTIPFGRTREVWRVVCACGAASMRWALTKIAVAGMWNRHMAEYVPKRRGWTAIKKE